MEKTWRDWIVQALRELGGKASYGQLYKRLREIRPEPFSTEWQASVRQCIEAHSSDSENFREGNADLFYSVHGKGHGYWGLRRDAAPSGTVEGPTLSWQKMELAEAIARCKGVPVEHVIPAVEKADDDKVKEWRSNLYVKAALAQIRAEKAAKVVEKLYR